VDIFGQVNRIIRAAFTRQSANPVVDTNTTGIYADTAGLPKVVIDTSGVRTDHHIVKSSAGGDAVTITTAGPTTLSVPTSGAVATLAGTQTLTNKKLSGGTASTDNEWDIPTTNDAGEAALATTTGSIYFNTTKQKLKIRTASDWAIVGGGLIVTPLSNPTTGSSLESGKHYIIYNLASDVTLKLPAGATEATVQVSVFGNASNGYRVTVQVADVPGTDTITYGSVTGYSAAKILNPDTWATFSWDGTSAWQVDDATVALSGTFSGSLAVTNALTAAGNVGIGVTSPTIPLQMEKAVGSTPLASFESTDGVYPKMQFISGTDANYGRAMFSFCKADGTETSSLGVNNYVGDGLEFRSAGTIRMYIGKPGSGAAVHLTDTNEWQPSAANGLDLGSAASTWSKLYTNGITSLGIFGNVGSQPSVGCRSDGVFFCTSSSMKYKKNIINYSKGLAEVMALRPVSYNSKTDEADTKTYAGFIAEEIADLGLSEFVFNDSEGAPRSLAYAEMVSLLTKAIQEQQAQIEVLKSEVAALKN
jgi:hypothetical protein